MKISLNWVKEYTQIDLETTELVDKIGRQLGEVEDVIDLTEVYKNIYIVKVVECIPHPQADKLSLCKIDDNRRAQNVDRDERGYVQVVCGAPNVAAGIKAVWLPPGTTVPATAKKDPFVLEPKEIRGQISNGMLASPKELAISDSHAGILEINNDVEIGKLFSDQFGLNDLIIDVENKMFTHRPDLFGQIGLAREIAGITGKQFSSPDWYLKTKNLNLTRGSVSLEVKNEIPDLVPRFMAQVITGIKVSPSSSKIQSYLNRVGLRPINNVVDFTNYFMMLTAQPLHAYDLDKLKALVDSQKANLTVRKAHNDEQLTLLNGKTIKLRESDILITSNGQAIGLGGVMGGSSTEVDDSTKNIVIECANFDMYAIRKTAMAHGLFSDAVTRFNKGQSPFQNDRVLAEMVNEMLSEVGGEAEAPIDIQTTLPRPVVINIKTDRINKLLGLNLKTADMAKLLRNVEFDVTAQPTELDITVPFWRTDIHIAEDIVEEVGRLYGYDNLVLDLPYRTIEVAPKNEVLTTKTEIRNILTKAGANELLSYSFVNGNLLDKVNQDKDQAYEIANALSPDLQYYRMSLIPSLLEKVHPNIKSGYQEYCLFEMNKVHIKNNPDEFEPDLPKEEYRLASIIAVDDKLANSDFGGAAYYQAKYYLDYLLYSLGINYRIENFSDELNSVALNQLAKPFEPVRSGLILIDDQIIGIVGEPSVAVRNNLKLPKYCAMFEIDLYSLVNNKKMISYSKLSNYPYVEQDVCFKVASDLSYQDLYNSLLLELTNIVSDDHISLAPLDIFQRSDDSAHKQITYRLRISSYNRTLKTSEINDLINRLGEIMNQRFGAEIV